MTSVVEIDGHQLVNALQPLSIQDHDDDDRDQSQMQSKKEIEEKGFRMVPDSVHWNEPNFPVLYPNIKLRREKGRPRTTRLRNEMDEGEEHQPRPLCSLCRQESHNRRTCPTRTVASSTSGQTE